jgi:hypothetical protein
MAIHPSYVDAMTSSPTVGLTFAPTMATGPTAAPIYRGEPKKNWVTRRPFIAALIGAAGGATLGVLYALYRYLKTFEAPPEEDAPSVTPVTTSESLTEGMTVDNLIEMVDAQTEEAQITQYEEHLYTTDPRLEPDEELPIAVYELNIEEPQEETYTPPTEVEAVTSEGETEVMTLPETWSMVQGDHKIVMTIPIPQGMMWSDWPPEMPGWFAPTGDPFSPFRYFGPSTTEGPLPPEVVTVW